MTHDECAKCGSTDLLTVHLSPGGTDVDFKTCRNCEHRWWNNREDQAVTQLGSVLQQIGGN